MHVLIDYDNLLDEDRRAGLLATTESIIQSLGRDRVKGDTTLSLRIYGGWHEGKNLSKDGQRVVTEVNQYFPTAVSIAGHGHIRICAELARSLLAEPNVVLWCTYRPDYPPRKVHCLDPSAAGCTKESCTMRLVQGFLRTGKCPDPACRINASTLLRQPQQKLVDSMIVVDLIHVAIQGEENVVVVTSDDDIWPGIRYASLRGTTVFHVHTRDRGCQVPVPVSDSHYHCLRM